MAVTTIVLVPLILYTLFLEDLLYYKLESQEPGIVANWDYATNDYMKGNLKDVGRLNRLKYCDHTAAFDSYNVGYDCNGQSIDGASGESGGAGDNGGGSDLSVGGGGAGSPEGHHQAGGAHQCWIVPGADQLRCYVDSRGGQTMVATTTSATVYLNSNWNRGGIVDCRARLGVMNYMLPNKVWGLMGTAANQGNGVAISGGKGRMQEAKTFVELDARTTDNNIHGDASGGAPNTWILREEHLYMLHDSWALNDIDKVDPGKGAPVPAGLAPGTDSIHPLLDRSAFYYNQFNSDSKTKANDYFDALKDDFLKENVANRDGIGGIGGDDPSTLPVFWDKPAQRQSDDGDGYASGWADTRQGTASNGRPNNKYPWEQ
jgi:hypothetical protein